MSLPNVNLTPQDFGLASIPASTSQVFAHVGVCSAGAPNVVKEYSGANLRRMLAELGTGPLVEAAAFHRSIAGGPAVLCPATPADGSAGAVTHTGTGTSTMTVDESSKHPLDAYDVQAQITRAAASISSGLGAFKYSLDGGTTWSPEIAMPTSGSYEIPGTGIVLAFAAGTLVVNDLYSFGCTPPRATVASVASAIDALLADVRTWGWLHVVGPPAPSSSAVTPPAGTPPAITLTGTPTAWVDAQVKVTLGGTLGVATFRYSLDDGGTWSADIASAATYEIPNTGLTLNMAAGTYILNDVYTFNTYGSIAALFAAVDTKMAAAEAAYRYAGAVLELPKASDAIIAKACAALSSERIMYAGGFCRLAPQVGQVGEGSRYESDAWPLCARRGKVPISHDLGAVADGAMQGASSLERDENATPGYGAARVATLRTITGYPGIHAASDTNGDMMAAPGSDFALSQHRAVMDRACTVLRAALIPFLNRTIQVNKTGANAGKILETEARSIEGAVTQSLEAALVSGPDGQLVSGLRVRIDRDEVILTTKNLTVDLAIVPLGTAKTITATAHYAMSI